MNVWFSSLSLLAELDRWRDLGSGFRGERTKVDWTDLWIGLAALAAVAVFFFLLSRYTASQDRRRSYHSPRALFQSLCTAHELDRGQKRLLRQLAKNEELEQTAQIFLEPACFDEKNLRGGLQSQVGAVVQLRLKLFGLAPLGEPSPKDVERTGP